ncbi:class I SAM-dependent methyltransferase [Streptomyces durmitorensis]|uniref:Class I SAM-dependent methyltransferase n=1 Tax=Streptomyces durmitorensis TaxID=319947 RepID=A0ABY4PQ31_9ACTN|nr:class I SAM-dependent methyltransferase [Streptomyces durmitorensis]UQT55113.1 class I SAM-dependent methyltransferase [Streptomyces durmitorensis]
MSEIHWIDGDTEHTARWHSETGMPAPRHVVPADDRMNASTAHRLACEGTALLWQGDYHQARQLLRAMGRRIDRKAPVAASAQAAFHLQRRASGHRARVLGRLVVPLGADHTLALRRAPDVRAACEEAYGPPLPTPSVVSLRELLGVLGAHQWRAKGVDVPAIGARIHPHYGVFSPVRGEYVDLVAQAPLPRAASLGAPAFDLGTGTGVLAAVLAHRGVRRVVATDNSPRALACARANMSRLGLTGQVEIAGGGALFPPGRAAVVVCNPPWLPAKPNSALEQGVYDPKGAMLHAFLTGLAAHLLPGGEGWLIMSDLAEHLGLRAPGELPSAIADAGLRVADRLDTRPRHPRASDPADPLHAARAAEVTSLWRLTAQRPEHSPARPPHGPGRSPGPGS